MTMTRYTLRDVGGALPWGALRHFLMYLPRESALSRETVPPTEEELWANGKATAAILADIFDLLHQLNNNVMAKGTGKSAKKAKPYPRPWRKGKQRKLGKDPIPIDQFEEWWESMLERRR